MRRPRRLPMALLGAAILALGTVVATTLAVRQARTGAAGTQRTLAAQAAASLRATLQTTSNRLADLTILVATVPEISRAGFERAARPLLADHAVSAVALVRRVPADQRRRFERSYGPIRGAVRRARSHRPAAYYPIVGGAARFAVFSPGLDLGGDRSRLRTLLAATDAGRTTATPPLPVASGGTDGIVLVAPIYRGGIVPATIAARRAAVLGFAIAVYRVDQLRTAVGALVPSRVPFAVEQDGVPVGGRRAAIVEPLTRAATVDGRRWAVTVARPRAAYGLAWTVLVCGALLTTALALLILQAVRRERYALDLVDERMGERDRAEAELRQSVARLAAAEQRFRTAFEAAPIGVALADLDGRFIEVNDALCAITGYTRDELEEMGFAELSHPEDVEHDAEMMRSLLSGEQSTFWMEKRYLDVVGQVVWVAVHATLIRAADGSPQHFLGQIQDVSERVRYEAQLQHMADHDPLTGLLNRRSFERELNQHITRVQRYGPEGAALVLDIDRFKHINDTLGHNVGDELIVKVAQTLRTRLRDSDVLARLGGDEFAVLLPYGGVREADGVARSILAAVRAQSVITGAGRRRPITASIGIALFADAQRLSAEDVLVNADLAMYDAKEAGRDRAAIFSTRGREASRIKTRITWAERIREALQEDRFTLYAQPIVELRSGEIRQHELLLRMIDEQGEIVPPAAFLNVAERFELMHEIDRWVIRRAIRHMGEQHAAGREVVFEVNISGSSTGDPELLTLIEDGLRESGVDPANLVLEVTETTAVANVPRAQRFAARLAELGCRFALDDFGAGFGSFYYLKHLPFDLLKIDGEFVRSCTTSQTDQLLIRAAVDIARGMGKQTIAEYVEDDQTVELLCRLGVDYAQGFHIGRPAPLEQHLALGTIATVASDS